MQRQILPDERQHDSILNLIEEGMEVYSSDDHHLGEVQEVFFGSVSEEEDRKGVGAATPDDPRMRQRNFMDDIAEALTGGEHLPEEMHERLLREGYIRIDGGFFSHDHFAMPDQIASVSGDRVILKATKDGLLAR